MISSNIPSPFYINIKLLTYFVFLYSGLIKWIPFPVDFTLFFGFFTLLFLLNDIRKEKFKLYSITIGYLYLVFFIFSLFYMLTYFYSLSTVYAAIKVRGVFLNMLAFTFPITSIRCDYSKNITTIITTLSLLMIGFLSFLLINDLFILFILPDEQQIKLFNVAIPTYLDVGAFISISFILLLNINSIYATLIKIVVFYFLIILGGRGPLLTLIFIVMISFLIKKQDLSKYFIYLFILVFLVLLYFYFDLSFIDFDRLNIFKNYGSDESVNDRIIFIGKCIGGFIDKPIFGNGIGATGMLISGQDIVLYPHNLFVEILAEFGMVGFVLFASIFIFFIQTIVHKKIPRVYIPFILIVFYLFMQDMKSGAFEAWRISCGWLAIATVFLNQSEIASEYLNKVVINKIPDK